MILELNTDDQTKELLESRRRYREQLATSYAAGEINTAKKLNPIIEDQNAKIATLSDENARLRKILEDNGIQP